MIFFKEQLSTLSQEELAKYHYLIEKHFNSAFALGNIDYKNEETKEFDVEIFNSLLPQYMNELNIECTSLESYFFHLEKICAEALMDFDQLFKQELRRKN